MSIRFYIPAPIAALYVNGEIVFRGSWPMAQYKRKYYGADPNVELHKAPYLKGVYYCNKCECATKDPYKTKYENKWYWKCKCMHINFV